ncbi:hypothetical protein KY289_030035 [Solanum tuberosum]|nr:hypothetical protein KY289_030035 [Solanum tuberosum]
MKLILQDEMNTIVTEIEDSSFHMDIFKLCIFEEVEIQHKIDENQLIDVVGHVVSYEPIQLSKQGDNNSSFMNIVVEDEQRNKLPATLWDDLAFQMQSHLSGSTDEPLIVVLQLMKTHKFREVLQLIEKTVNELKAGLIGDANMGYPIELDSLIEKRLMFKVQIKDSNINKNDNVYRVVKFIDDEALLKEYCHPSLIHNLNTPIKNSISDFASSQNEDVIDLTGKLYPNSGKHVGVRPTHSNDEGLNVKLPSNKLRKVIKEEKKA